INDSDMLLKPDLTYVPIDPFYDEPTLIVKCDVIEPTTMQIYDRDPRGVARRAEKYLKDSDIADLCFFGPEVECFAFVDVRFKVTMREAFFKLDSEEAAWNCETEYEDGNYGHRPPIKGGYFPVPPVDSSQDLRSAITLTLQELGFVVETHHHEVATGNQI